MSVSRLLLNTRSTVRGAIRGTGQSDALQTLLSPYGLPLLGALLVGGLLALFIVNQQWYLVFAILLLVPAVILFNTYPFTALLIWLLLGPFLQVAVDRGFRIVFWIIHRALPPAVLALVVFAHLFRISRRRWRGALGTAEFAALALLGLSCLNVLWFHIDALPQLYLVYDQLFVPFCLYLLVRLLPLSERDLRLLLPVAFVIVLSQTIVGILAWFAPQVLPAAWLSYQGARTTGTLGYPHAYTTTLVFYTFLLFHDAMTRKPALARFSLLMAFGLGAFAIFLSFVRGSWLGALLAGMGLLYLYPRAVLRLLLVLLIVAAVLGGTVLSTEMAFARQRLNSESTAKDRLVIWDAGLSMIRAKPLFGWGSGNYARYAGQFQRRVLDHVVTYAHASHNSYIGLAAELGLPALFLFFLPVLWWLKLTLEVWPRMPRTGFLSRSLLAILWLVILDHIVVSSFSDMRHSTYGMGMWWITLGLIGALVGQYLPHRDTALAERLERWSHSQGLLE
jgi:O-antigen ligase